MSKNYEAYLVFGADKLQLEKLLRDYFFGGPFLGVEVSLFAENVIDIDTNRIMGKDLVWRIRVMGEREPSGHLKIIDYPTGSLLLYETYEGEIGEDVDMVVFGVDNLLSNRGLEIRPYGEELNLIPKDLEYIHYKGKSGSRQDMSRVVNPETEEKIIALLMDRKIMREFYKDYSTKTAEEIIKAIPIAYEKYSDKKWGPGVISKDINVSVTTVGRYLKAFWFAGVYKIGGVPIPYRPRSNQ